MTPKVFGMVPMVIGVSPKLAGMAPKVTGVTPMVTGVSPEVIGVTPELAGITTYGRAIADSAVPARPEPERTPRDPREAARPRLHPIGQGPAD